MSKLTALTALAALITVAVSLFGLSTASAQEASWELIDTDLVAYSNADMNPEEFLHLQLVAERSLTAYCEPPTFTPHRGMAVNRDFRAHDTLGVMDVTVEGRCYFEAR